METPAANAITDRRGVSLPDPPTAEDIERQADRLRILSEDELPEQVLHRVGHDELERRRRQAITR